MGLKALNKLLIMLLILGPAIAFAQSPGPLFSSSGNFLPFSNQYNYREDLLADVQPGHLGGVWRARMYGADAKLETQSAELAGIDFFLEGKYKLIETLEANVFLRMKFESGRSQDFYGDLYPSNNFLAKEASLQYTPLEWLRLKAGIINQDWLNQPLLLSSQSFPGASGRLSYEFSEQFEASFTSQFAIPTSQTLSTRTTGREATPEFITNTLGARWHKEDVSVIGNFSLFEYKNLPSNVAFISQKYGNTVSYDVITGPNNSSFTYPFKGWFANVTGEYRLTHRFEPNVSFSRLKNEKAPESYNNGQLIGVGNKFHMENHIAYLGYEDFFVESDAAVSFYNSPAYGNTNSKGHGVEAWWQFKKHNFRIRAQYYRSNVINRGISTQQNQDYYYLAVETGYDRI